MKITTNCLFIFKPYINGRVESIRRNEGLIVDVNCVVLNFNVWKKQPKLRISLFKVDLSSFLLNKTPLKWLFYETIFTFEEKGRQMDRYNFLLFKMLIINRISICEHL